jgi:S-adenosylmethionine hydrolase
VWVANRIRYPGSPHCKRCTLGVISHHFLKLNVKSKIKIKKKKKKKKKSETFKGQEIVRGSAAANAISVPPGEYARKGETQRN